MAITSAGVPVSAATHATKQRWNCPASSVANISPRGSAEVSVGGRSKKKRPETAQKFFLLFAEPRDIDKCLRPAQHRQQTKQQHLVERIDHLAGLPGIRQILEII